MEFLEKLMCVIKGNPGSNMLFCSTKRSIIADIGGEKVEIDINMFGGRIAHSELNWLVERKIDE